MIIKLVLCLGFSALFISVNHRLNSTTIELLLVFTIAPIVFPNEAIPYGEAVKSRLGHFYLGCSKENNANMFKSENGAQFRNPHEPHDTI